MYLKKIIIQNCFITEMTFCRLINENVLVPFSKFTLPSLIISVSKLFMLQV